MVDTYMQKWRKNFMSIFDKKKVAFMLACASFFGGKNSLAVESSNSVGGVVTPRKKMNNLTKGLITGGSIIGVITLLYATRKKWMPSRHNEKKEIKALRNDEKKKIEVLNNILKKIGEVDTKIHRILNVKQNDDLMSCFETYLKDRNEKTKINELDYFQINNHKLVYAQDELVKVYFVNCVNKITKVFDKKISPDTNDNDNNSIEFDKNEDVVVNIYDFGWIRWNFHVDKVNKKLKVNEKLKMTHKPSHIEDEIYILRYELEIDLEKFGLSNLLEEYPS